MLGLLSAIVATPLALDAALPEMPHDRVGVYERVGLTDPGPRGAVAAGFIAPAGWLWVGGRESGLFTTVDGRDAIRVELRTGVADPEALMRGAAPVGAVALPAGRFAAGAGLEVSALEHDLAAGDNPAIDVVACTAAQPANCLLVLGTFSADITGPDAEADRDRAERALEGLLASAEVID